MNVSVEETGPAERRLHIEVPTTDVDAAFSTYFQVMRRSAHIKGFRPGKAPREVLEKYFGDRAAGEVLQRLVEQTLPKAIQDQNLDVLGEPRLDPREPPKPGARFAYDADVDVRPAIGCGQARALGGEAPGPADPEKEPVEGHLDELRRARPSWSKSQGRRRARVTSR
jgi:trigger factor